MTTYRYKAIRKSDGAEIVSDTIDDVLEAGIVPMKMTILAGLIHAHPMARGLKHDDILIQMRAAEKRKHDPNSSSMS